MISIQFIINSIHYQFNISIQVKISFQDMSTQIMISIQFIINSIHYQFNSLSIQYQINSIQLKHSKFQVKVKKTSVLLKILGNTIETRNTKLKTLHRAKYPRKTKKPKERAQWNTLKDKT